MGLFSKPKQPKLEEVKPPPTAQDATPAAADELARLAKRRGFGAALVANGAEGLGQGQLGAGAKLVLGAG